jgi:acyl-coenzyme A synthetase/AMP-(fatty) acid ligase
LFHNDPSDAVAFLYVNPVHQGGESLFASSVAIHNAMLASVPRQVRTLYRDPTHSYQDYLLVRTGANARLLPRRRTYRMPVFSAARVRQVLAATAHGFEAAGPLLTAGSTWSCRSAPAVGASGGPPLCLWQFADVEAGGGAPLPDELCLVLHTSGSTGQPRGVMLLRGNVQQVLAQRIEFARFNGDSTLMVASCLAQSVGLYQSFAVLAAGGTQVLLPSYDAGRMAAAVNRHAPTHLIMVVDAFDRLLHHQELSPRSLEHLSFAAVGADRATARVQDRFIALTGRPMCTTYSLTESSWALVNRGDRIDRRLALGTEGAGVEVRLLSAAGQPVAVDAVGEIHIRSPRTMIGYLHDVPATRAVLRDGWLATGDLARRDAEGCCWFAGRSKNIIVLPSGDTVSPVEIEQLLLDVPGIAACAVVGVVTAQEAEVPWAFVAAGARPPSETELRARLGAQLSSVRNAPPDQLRYRPP